MPVVDIANSQLNRLLAPMAAQDSPLTQYDQDFLAEATDKANQYVDVNNPGSGVARYDFGLCMYREYYRTGNTLFLDKARLSVEHHRDGVGTPDQWNPQALFEATQLNSEAWNNLLIISFANQNHISTGMAIYYWEHGDTGVRKVADILKYYTALNFGHHGRPGLGISPRPAAISLCWIMDTETVLGTDFTVLSVGQSWTMPQMRIAALNEIFRSQFPDGLWYEWNPDRNMHTTNFFYLGILGEQLARYDYIFGDPRITPALIRCYDAMEPRWFPSEQAYAYSDDIFQGTGPELGLNGHYIAFIGRLYAVTGDGRYKERIQQLLSGMHRRRVTDGHTMKEFQQNYRSSDQGIAWVISRDGGNIPPIPPPTVFDVTVELQFTGDENTTYNLEAVVNPAGSYRVEWTVNGVIKSVDQSVPYMLFQEGANTLGQGDQVVTANVYATTGTLILASESFVVGTAPGEAPVSGVVTSPLNNDEVSGVVNIIVDTEGAGILGVQFRVGGINLGAEVTSSAPPAGGSASGLRHLPGRRFFVDDAGNAVYLTGSHNWNNVTEWGLDPTTPGNPPSTFNFTAYLADLVSWGHTVVRFWCLGDFVTYNGSNIRSKFPWGRSGTPGASDGGNKWDLTTFDSTYFSTLRSRVLATRAAGLYAIICFFNGYDNNNNLTGKNIWHDTENVTVDGDVNNNGQTEEIYNLSTTPAAALTAQKAFIHRVIDELDDIDGIVWEIINEPGSYAESWVNHIIADLIAYEQVNYPTQRRPIAQGFLAWSDGSTNQQIFNMNVDAVLPASASINNAGGSPDGAGDYGSDPVPSSGNKVVIVDTDHIFGIGGDEDLIWKLFCRGINPIYMDPLTANAMYTRARNAMGATADLVALLVNDLNDFTPQPTSITTPSNTGYCLYKPGAEYIVFRPSGGPSTVLLDLEDVSSESTFSYSWRNVGTLAVVASGSTSGGAIRSFAAPNGDNLVLYLAPVSVSAGDVYTFFGFDSRTKVNGSYVVDAVIRTADGLFVTTNNPTIRIFNFTVGQQPGPQPPTNPPPGTGGGGPGAGGGGTGGVDSGGNIIDDEIAIGQRNGVVLDRFRARHMEPIFGANYAAFGVRQQTNVTRVPLGIYFAAGESGDIPGIWNRSYQGGAVWVTLSWMAVTQASGSIVWGASFERHVHGVTDLDTEVFSTETTVLDTAPPTGPGVISYCTIVVPQVALQGLRGGESYTLRLRRLSLGDTLGGFAIWLAAELFTPPVV